MERHIDTQIRLDPLSQAAEFRIAVVESGHHEVNNLCPLTHLFQSDQRIQHRLQLSRDHFAVVRLRECFQIDLDRVHLSVCGLQRFLLHVAIRNHHAAEAGLVSGIGYIHQEFTEDHRLAVGVGNGWTAVLFRQFDNPLRGNVVGGDLLGTRLGDVPVLAEFAVDVAAGGGQRERERPGQVMEEGLLLDGIDVRRAHARMHQRVVGSSAILPHSAIAAFAISHRAFARTQLALDLPILKFLVELCFHCKLGIILLLLSGLRGYPGSGMGRLAQSQSRSRRHGALQKRTAIEGTAEQVSLTENIETVALLHLCLTQHNEPPGQAACYASTTEILMGSFVPSRCCASAAVAI